MTNECNSAPDAWLVAWMIEGRPECVSELMARYGGALRRLLLRTLGDDADLDDVFQETWLRVIRHAHRYDPTFAFGPWLFRIAWNLAQNRLKQRSRTARQELKEEPDQPRAETRQSADIQFQIQERDALLRDRVLDLPSHLSEVIFLRYFEDLTEREMADRLGVPKGTVKSRLHTAHHRLASLVGEMS